MNVRIRTLAKRVKDNPSDTLSKFALALELVKLNELKKAQILFEQIQHHEPEYIGVYYHLGHLYAEQGENKKAVDMYKKGIEMAELIKDQHSKSELTAALLTIELENDL